MDVTLGGSLAKDVMKHVNRQNKEEGDNESSCLRPLPCLIGSPAMPFSNSLEEEVDGRAEIQFKIC